MPDDVTTEEQGDVVESEDISREEGISGIRAEMARLSGETATDDSGDDEDVAVTSKSDDSKNAVTSEPDDDDNSDLLERAKAVGLTKADLEEFGDKAEAMVDRFARLHDEKLVEMTRAAREQGAGAEDEKPKEDVQEQAQTDQQKSIADELKPLLDESGIGEDDPLHKVVMALASRVEGANQQLQNVEQKEAQAKAEQAQREALDYLHSLPDEYAKLWGKGDVEKVTDLDFRKTTDPRVQFVREVFETMDVLNNGYLSQYGRYLTTKELGDKALAMVAKDKAREIADREMAAKLKKRQRGMQSKPSDRKNRPPEALTEEDSISGIKEAMVEFGLK